jgi:hypothetical protein
MTLDNLYDTANWDGMADVPSWSDQYTSAELGAGVDYEAIKCEKRGDYDNAGFWRALSEWMSDYERRVEERDETIAALAAEIRQLRSAMRSALDELGGAK